VILEEVEVLASEILPVVTIAVILPSSPESDPESKPYWIAVSAFFSPFLIWNFFGFSSG